MTEQLVSIELPENIGNLTELKKFDCHENKLTSELPRIFSASVHGISPSRFG